MAAALAAFHTANPEAGLADGLFVLERPLARVRAHTLRDIVGRFDPPLNLEHRKAPAAPEIAALVADRAEGLAGAGERPGADIQVTEEDLGSRLNGTSMRRGLRGTGTPDSSATACRIGWRCAGSP